MDVAGATRAVRARLGRRARAAPVLAGVASVGLGWASSPADGSERERERATVDTAGDSSTLRCAWLYDCGPPLEAAALLDMAHEVQQSLMQLPGSPASACCLAVVRVWPAGSSAPPPPSDEGQAAEPLPAHSEPCLCTFGEAPESTHRSMDSAGASAAASVDAAACDLFLVNLHQLRRRLRQALTELQLPPLVHVASRLDAPVWLRPGLRHDGDDGLPHHGVDCRRAAAQHACSTVLCRQLEVLLRQLPNPAKSQRLDSPSAVVDFAISEPCSACAVYGWLLEYPVLYWLAPRDGSKTCLNDEPLRRCSLTADFPWTRGAGAPSFELFSFTIPECLLADAAEASPAASLAHWRACMAAKSTLCASSDLRLHADEKTVSMPFVGV